MGPTWSYSRCNGRIGSLCFLPSRPLKGSESGSLWRPLLFPNICVMERVLAQRASPPRRPPPPASGRAEGVGSRVCTERREKQHSSSVFPFPSVSLDLPGGCCCCRSARRLFLFSTSSSPPRLLSVSPQRRGALFAHPPRPPCKLSRRGITDGVTHREVQGTTERRENEGDKSG